MTPDTRTTENPEPRTEAGRTLMDALPLNEWHPINTDIVRDHILAIEAEAAQGAAPAIDASNANANRARIDEGAAPRAEGLDEEAVRNLIVRAYQRGFGNGRYNNAPPAPMRAVEELLPLTRLAPQERRDKEGTE